MKNGQVCSRSRQLVTALMLSVLVPLSVRSQQSSDDETFARFARYGADVWAANESAKLSGEGEACISCHTSVPYALVEPLLPGDYPAYTDLIANVDNRIRTWNDNLPWYAEGKRRARASIRFT
jgi:hypothetical protein